MNTKTGIEQSSSINNTFSEKLVWISFISSILIVMTHAANRIFDWYAGKEDIFYNSVKYLQYLAIPIMAWFFFTSAYFFFRRYTFDIYTKQLKKRVLTLLIPFLCWNLIAFIMNIVVLYLFYELGPITLHSFLKSFVFLYYPGNLIESANGPLWYIIRIFTYMIFAPQIYLICKNKNFFIGFLSILILGNLYFEVNYYSFFYWLPMFILGSYIAINHKDSFENLLGKQTINGKKIHYLIGTVLFLILYGVIYLFTPYLEYNVYIYLVRITAVPIIILCVYLITNLPKPNWLVAHSSFYIYCSHIIVLRCISPIIYEYVYPYINNSLLMYVIIILVTLVIIIISQYILNKFFRPVLSILTGTR